jgi:hypothetical protein
MAANSSRLKVTDPGNCTDSFCAGRLIRFRWGIKEPTSGSKALAERKPARSFPTLRSPTGRAIIPSCSSMLASGKNAQPADNISQLLRCDKFKSRSIIRCAKWLPVYRYFRMLTGPTPPIDRRFDKRRKKKFANSGVVLLIIANHVMQNGNVRMSGASVAPVGPEVRRDPGSVADWPVKQCFRRPKRSLKPNCLCSRSSGRLSRPMAGCYLR